MPIAVPLIPALGGKPMFMAVPQADNYRWVGRRYDSDGLVLATVRTDPVAVWWKPVPVEWLPETIRRPTCDFPIFHPIVRCISKRAESVLAPFSECSLEFLPVVGLSDEYVAIHCIKWQQGLIAEPDDPRISIHSTLYAPQLERATVSGSHIFGVLPLVAKLFVSQAVKDAIEQAQLTGLDFHPVAAV